MHKNILVMGPHLCNWCQPEALVGHHLASIHGGASVHDQILIQWTQKITRVPSVPRKATTSSKQHDDDDDNATSQVLNLILKEPPGP